jgi:hypothetical protein
MASGHPIFKLKNQRMKKKLFKLAFLAMVVVAAGAFSNTASAQVYVTVRPAWHAVVRPVAPSPGHVWIDEEWEARGGHYVAVGGYWAVPPHPGWVWIPGHWAREHRGEYWIRGHWARR